MDAKVADIIRKGGRDKILNERFLHHMFSSYLACSLGIGHAWDSLQICQDYPSTIKFSRDHIDLNCPEKTRNEAIGRGKCRNIDFVVSTEARIWIEWKGPIMPGSKELAEKFIKLLVVHDDASPKVFAPY